MNVSSFIHVIYTNVNVVIHHSSKCSIYNIIIIIIIIISLSLLVGKWHKKKTLNFQGFLHINH